MRPHLVFIVTVPVTARVLLRGQLSSLREHGFEITVISSPGADLDLVGERERVRVIGIPMAREPDPLHDAVSLARLTRVLRQLRPHIVNASTAKAGLLGMVAAAAARVPVRVYLLRGLRLETETGMKRSVLAATERIAVACADEIVCVSESLRDRYVADGFAAASKCLVLGAGSSNGVDVGRFARTDIRRGEAAALRRQLAIPADAPVIGFVGRPVRDKGIGELLDAFDLVIARRPDTRLVLLGAGFADDSVDPAVARRLVGRSNVIVVDHVAEPAPYFAMMDVLAFPSYREGFPNVPLEAAAAEVPTVGFRATGTRDAVRDGETGALVEIGDSRGLGEQLARYATDPGLRAAHGRRARERVERDFTHEAVWNQWSAEYTRLLLARGLPLPG